MPYFVDFSILITENYDFKLKVMDSLLIAYGKPVLNKVNTLTSLELFS